MNDELICNCGVVGEEVVEPRELSFGHWTTSVDDHFLRCPECGEKWYLPGQMQAMLLAAAKQIREEHGLFDPERIRNLRARYGWTQIDLERVLGVGAKTVVRWERGAVVPGAGVNRLLEILENNPDEARKLSLKHGAGFKPTVLHPTTAMAYSMFWVASVQLLDWRFNAPSIPIAFSQEAAVLNRARISHGVTYSVGWAKELPASHYIAVQGSTELEGAGIYSAATDAETAERLEVA